LKTASQGTYITPTWKESDVKLKSTIAKYVEESKNNKVDWLQKVDQNLFGRKYRNR